MPWGALVDEDVLQAFAVVAPLSDVAAALRVRCEGVIDRVLPAFPAGLSEEAIDEVLDEVRKGSAAAGVVGNESDRSNR